MHLQAVIFDKEHYDTYRAMAWLNKHHYHPIKHVHKTKNWLRYRISEPDYKHYITIQLKGGKIHMIMGY